MPSISIVANPARRRSRKPRSAAQRAATARMLAANRTRRNPARRRRKSTAVVAAPRRSAARRTSRRVARRRGSNGGMGGSVQANAINLLKNGAIGGAGAIGVDVLMGFAGKVLPATMMTRFNADGGLNFSYYAAKGAIALGVGMLGRKVIPPAMAAKAAEGAFVVMSYEIARSMIPADTLTLGYMGPAPVMPRVNMPRVNMRPSLNGMRGAGVGRYLSGMGAYNKVPSASGARSGLRLAGMR